DARRHRAQGARFPPQEAGEDLQCPGLVQEPPWRPPARAVRRRARTQVPPRRQIQHLLLLMTQETAGEETFISHLVELRDRLVKATYGIVLACIVLMLWPGPAQIYDFLAAPMLASLPVGAK